MRLERNPVTAIPMRLLRLPERIVAKWAHGTYQTDGRGTSWLKIKNPDYAQIVDPHELFRRPSTARRPTPRIELRLASV